VTCSKISGPVTVVNLKRSIMKHDSSKPEAEHERL